MMDTEAIAANTPEVPDGWKPLTDAQWVNIVNLNQAWFGYSVEDAVHEVVKLTEARLKTNNAAPQPQPVAQPVQAQPKGCFRCVTPNKCAIYGCCPGTWPTEMPSTQQ